MNYLQTPITIIIFLFFVMITPRASIAEVLMVESFDQQADWHSGLLVNDLNSNDLPDIEQIGPDYLLPSSWYAVRQDPKWSPSVGNSMGHETIEILASNSSKARGETGKSYVSWRDSKTPAWYWNSDSMLTQYFPDGLDQVYVSFWIKFSPEWTPLGSTGQSKLFRISSWDAGNEGLYGFGTGRNNGPLFFWDYKTDAYGTRNFLALRGYPFNDSNNTNYYLQKPAPINLPRSGNNNDLSMNFDNNIRDLNGDGIQDNEVSLLNLVTGQPLSGGIVSHEEVWGTQWHKMEFFVKMNSGPGAFDGVLMQWMDGQLIFKNTDMPWHGDGSLESRKWNVISFGGNDHFHAYDDSIKRQEWYSIDDIIIATEVVSGPKPPTNLLITD
jgi:hypothetical protein